jgi:hypothetical protein
MASKRRRNHRLDVGLVIGFSSIGVSEEGNTAGDQRNVLGMSRPLDAERD